MIFWVAKRYWTDIWELTPLRLGVLVRLLFLFNGVEEEERARCLISADLGF